MGNYIIDSEGFKEYFSPYGYEAYVLTGPLSRLGLKPEPEPKDAPLYLDLETGEGYFPEGVSAQKANDAAQYTKFWASVMSLCILEKIMNLGEKNSQSYSAWVMLVSSGMLIWMSMILTTTVFDQLILLIAYLYPKSASFSFISSSSCS